MYPQSAYPGGRYDDMRAQPNISTSAKMPGIMPVYVGMEMTLTESRLPPRLVRGTPVKAAGVELRLLGPPVTGGSSLAQQSCVAL